MPPSMARAKSEKLRTGWTTGTCAAAAAKAAAKALVSGKPQREVNVRLPRKGEERRVAFGVERCELSLGEGWAEAVVVKDAGDDPDVTDGAHLTARVCWKDEPGLELDRGEGVGVVTKPGLGLAVGGPAINDVPRRMISYSVKEVLDPDERGVRVVVSVPGGEKMAEKTTNARLGIVGGISILGITGIVRPFSTAAWRASVGQAINVMGAQKHDTLVLSTGGLTEKAAMRLLPDLEEVCFVEVGDFTGYALKRAVKNGLERVFFVGMAGKLAKLAAGVMIQALLQGVEHGQGAVRAAHRQRRRLAAHVVQPLPGGDGERRDPVGVPHPCPLPTSGGLALPAAAGEGHEGVVRLHRRRD